MSSQEFWKRVFIACIKAGRDKVAAKDIADYAVGCEWV